MKRQSRPRIDELENLIWIQTSFLGDIILQTAALRLVQLQAPHIRQYLITTGLGAKALAGHPALHKIVVFEKRGRSMSKAVQAVKSQLDNCQRERSVVLQAHRSMRSSLLARSLGFFTVTYDESHGAFFAQARVPRVAVLHEAQRISLLLEPLGISREQSFGAEPFLPKSSSAAVQEWLGAHHQPFIAIAPGSVWGTKRWPVQHFIAMARMLLDKTSATLVILGSGDEVQAATEMSDSLAFAAPRVINLAGKTSLDDLRDVYPRLSLLISNDSSPLHYASAFQVPSLAIFGATVPGLGFGPLAPSSRVAEISLACRPCSDHGPQVCPLGHFRCMRDLLPEKVAHLALEILASRNRPLEEDLSPVN